MGTYLLTSGNHLILPTLDTPIKDVTSLSNVDFSKCFVKVDVVEMSMSGKEQRHYLGGNAVPTSKVRSDLRTLPDAFGFSSLGGPHATPQPAPSALNNGCL